MKKTFLTLILSLVAVCSYAVEAKIGAFTYNVYPTYAQVIDYDVTDGGTDVIIPDSITWGGFTMPVTQVGGNVNGTYKMPFKGKAITSIVGNNITHLNWGDNSINNGDGAFTNCKSLTTAVFPKVVYSVRSFYNCTSLTTVSMPSLQRAHESFVGCTSLTSISLPDLRYAFKSFYNCSLLSSVDLPELRVASCYTFANCTSLTEVTAPMLRVISYYVFNGCSSLTSIYFPSLQYIGYYVQNLDSFLSGDSEPTISGGGYNYYNSYASYYDTYAYSFTGCKRLTTVSFPSLINIYQGGTSDFPSSLQYAYIGNSYNAYTKFPNGTWIVSTSADIPTSTPNSNYYFFLPPGTYEAFQEKYGDTVFSYCDNDLVAGEITHKYDCDQHTQDYTPSAAAPDYTSLSVQYYELKTQYNYLKTASGDIEALKSENSSLKNEVARLTPFEAKVADLTTQVGIQETLLTTYLARIDSLNAVIKSHVCPTVPDDTIYVDKVIEKTIEVPVYVHDTTYVDVIKEVEKIVEVEKLITVHDTTFIDVIKEVEVPTYITVHDTITVTTENTEYIKSLENKCFLMLQRIDELTHDLSAAQSSFNALQEQIDDLNEQIDEMKREIATSLPQVINDSESRPGVIYNLQGIQVNSIDDIRLQSFYILDGKVHFKR